MKKQPHRFGQCLLTALHTNPIITDPNTYHGTAWETAEKLTCGHWRSHHVRCQNLAPHTTKSDVQPSSATPEKLSSQVWLHHYEHNTRNQPLKTTQPFTAALDSFLSNLGMHDRTAMLKNISKTRIKPSIWFRDEVSQGDLHSNV